MQDSRWGLTRVEQRGRIPSLDLLATLLLLVLDVTAGTGTILDIYSHQTKYGPEMLCNSVHPWG